MITNSADPGHGSANPVVRRLRARKESRRRREIALLALSLVFVAAAIWLDEPALILISVFPALASYGQR
jgi:hypothetical protein